MDTAEFELDAKGYAYDGLVTLVSQEFSERGGYYAIHDNRPRCATLAKEPPFSVSFFATDEAASDRNSWTFPFSDYREVKRYLQAVGIRFEETETVKNFFA